MSRERVQAECRMIGAILARPGAMRALRATPIGADHFAEPEYRRTFEAAAALAEDGERLDVERVAARAGLSSGWRDSLATAVSQDNGASLEDLASELADLAEASGNDRPGLDLEKRWVTFSTADLTTDPPAKEFLWAGTIPAGDVGVFAAKGGAGKTALLTGLAIHRALGRPFLGRAVKQGTTTIVTAEDGRDDYLRKLAAWRSWIPDLALEANRAAIARHLHLVDLVGIPFKLITSKYGEYLATAHIEMLATAIAGRAPETDLIIIETVSRVGGDEGNAAMSALVCAAEELARLTGAAVLLVAHVSQDAARRNIGDAYAPRGGTAIGANGRYTMTLTGLTDETTAELLPGVALSPQQQRELSVFRVPKINAAPEPEPVVLQIVPTRWGLVLRGYEVGNVQDEEERRRDARQATGESLLALAKRMAGVEQPLTVSRLSRGLHKEIPGLTKQRIDSAVADAIEDGYLRQEARTGRGGGTALLPGTLPRQISGQIS